MAWYKDWFGQDYLDLYKHRDAGEAALHIDFVERLFASASPHAVLDLACGAGRHTRELRRRGYRALGTDLSLTLLNRGEGLPRVASDMKALPFDDASFDWVLNFFTSFGYFETERQNFQVLEEIVRVLRPGGRCMIDIFNAPRVLETLRPKDEQEIASGRVFIERWYDEKTRRINKRMRLERAGREPKTYLESVRAYSRDEVVSGLSWAGVDVLETYGGFDGSAFAADSERLICVGRRTDA